jgi:hypothetical protein
VLDLQPVELGHVVDVAQVLQPRVLRRYAQDLVVAALLVGHPEHADGPAADQAARKGRLLHEYQRVERVAVLTQRAFDETVIGRILGSGEKGPIEADSPGTMIYLVLVALSLGDLNRHIEVHLGGSPVCLASGRSAGRHARGADRPH